MVGRKIVDLRTRAALPGSRRGSSEKMSRRMVVIGAGRMGADIALAFVRGGWECDVVEPVADARERALKYWGNELRRLRSISRMRYMHLHTALEELAWPSVELVVEAVPEDIDLKHAVLRRVEGLSRLVEEGHFGVTTGRGFYKWDKKTTAKRLERFAELLGQSLKRIKRVGEPSEF